LIIDKDHKQLLQERVATTKGKQHSSKQTTH
jgi:hypothetical protein